MDAFRVRVKYARLAGARSFPAGLNNPFASKVNGALRPARFSARCSRHRLPPPQAAVGVAERPGFHASEQGIPISLIIPCYSPRNRENNRENIFLACFDRGLKYQHVDMNLRVRIRELCGWAVVRTVLGIKS
jgi:hypothetical protein